MLVGHGYGMSGDTDPESESEELFGSVGLGPLRRAGFNVLTWDARGFGGSGGQVEVDSAEFEGRVRVRPVRIHMRAVRVVLRDRRGRVVGRSRRVRIGTAGRAVVVRVRRPIRADARYRFGARGRAVDGRRLSTSRRVAVRR